MTNFEATFTADQVLKFANPADEIEAAERWIVIEDNGDRVHVGLIGAKGFGQRACYHPSEFVAA